MNRSKKLRWRWWTAALTLAVMTLMLASCSKETTQPHIAEAKKQVALVLKTQHSDFWRTVRTGAEAAAKEFNVELIVEAPVQEEDVAGQVKYVEEAINFKRDALVLAANDGAALAEPVKRAAAQRMPVIAIDTEVETGKTEAFIGINHYEAGRKAGKKLAELLGGKGRVALVSYKPDARNAAERERGVLESLAQHPDIRIADKTYCYSDQRLCGEHARQLVQSAEPVDGIVALHAVSSIGVAEEIERLGLQGKVKVVTFDSTLEDIEYLQEGVIQATIIQNPFSMGYLGVKYAVDLLGGSKKVPARYDTGTTVIDQNNMFWSDNQKLLFPFVK
ncbi:substrate-binding domain-containing protein [Paenibacillus sp.]|uniref:substrate-binding domain-containing protein n=1 Tax=Paenibacillus sp. TaxID=58172 RepID=UPI00356A4DAE